MIKISGAALEQSRFDPPFFPSVTTTPFNPSLHAYCLRISSRSPYHNLLSRRLTGQIFIKSALPFLLLEILRLPTVHLLKNVGHVQGTFSR